MTSRLQDVSLTMNLDTGNKSERLTQTVGNLGKLSLLSSVLYLVLTNFPLLETQPVNYASVPH